MDSYKYYFALIIRKYKLFFETDKKIKDLFVEIIGKNEVYD
jgi:hypothetical protein